MTFLVPHAVCISIYLAMYSSLKAVLADYSYRFCIAGCVIPEPHLAEGLSLTTEGLTVHSIAVGGGAGVHKDVAGTQIILLDIATG